MVWPPVLLQVVRVAEAAHWSMTPELGDIIRESFSGIGSTKCCEDGFQRLRGKESKTSNRGMANMRQWLTLIESSILEEAHRFQQIPWKDEPAPRGLTGTASSMFTPPVMKPGDYKQSLQKLVGQSPGAAWYSPSAGASAQVDMDLELLRHCVAGRCLEMASQSWWSVLLFSKGLLAQCTKHYGDQWFFCTDSGFGNGEWAWPAERVAIGSAGVAWRLKGDAGQGDSCYQTYIAYDVACHLVEACI
jgi:hypothetical protein